MCVLLKTETFKAKKIKDKQEKTNHQKMTTVTAEHVQL